MKTYKVYGIMPTAIYLELDEFMSIEDTIDYNGTQYIVRSRIEKSEEREDIILNVVIFQQL